MFFIILKTVRIIRYCILGTFLLTANISIAQDVNNSALPKGNIFNFFSWDEQRTPMYSAHRGGAQERFPENCLATLKKSSAMGASILEVDVSMTKDSILVLLHDKTLDRTTTGKGPLFERTFKEISSLKLKDNSGNVTEYSIPVLDSVLVWAKGRAILSLDVKRNVPFAMVIEKVKEYAVENNVVLIVYNTDDLKTVYRLAPNIMISATIRNLKELEMVKKTGVPFKNVVAFTGTIASDASLYNKIHEQGSFCIMGTMGNIDNKAKAKGMIVYHKLFDKGVDIIAGDLPELTLDALQNYIKK